MIYSGLYLGFSLRAFCVKQREQGGEAEALPAASQWHWATRSLSRVQAATSVLEHGIWGWWERTLSTAAAFWVGPLTCLWQLPPLTQLLEAGHELRVTVVPRAWKPRWEKASKQPWQKWWHWACKADYNAITKLMPGPSGPDFLVNADGFRDGFLKCFSEANHFTRERLSSCRQHASGALTTAAGSVWERKQQ